MSKGLTGLLIAYALACDHATTSVREDVLQKAIDRLLATGLDADAHADQHLGQPKFALLLEGRRRSVDEADASQPLFLLFLPLLLLKTLTPTLVLPPPLR